MSNTIKRFLKKLIFKRKLAEKKKNISHPTHKPKQRHTHTPHPTHPTHAHDTHTQRIHHNLRHMRMISTLKYKMCPRGLNTHFFNEDYRLFQYLTRLYTHLASSSLSVILLKEDGSLR